VSDSVPSWSSCPC